jgi:hypothetical protein
MFWNFRLVESDSSGAAGWQPTLAATHLGPIIGGRGVLTLFWASIRSDLIFGRIRTKHEMVAGGVVF